MITLYVSGAYFGLPDPSPFVTKMEVLLKMSGLPYKSKPMSFGRAPKGKVPYMEDGGPLLGDSTFIRIHLERKYGINFDSDYTSRDLAVAWSIEKMLEEHLYWILVHDRWANAENFERGPKEFFLAAPAPTRPFVKAMVKRQVRKSLYAHGMGRHTDSERSELGKRDIDAVAEVMGASRYLLGDRPCGADAAVYSFLLGMTCPLFNSAVREYTEAKTNLMDYLARMSAQFYPDGPNAKA